MLLSIRFVFKIVYLARSNRLVKTLWSEIKDTDKWQLYNHFWSFFAFRVAAAQCKKICPVGLNWPGRLAGIFEGARSISKINSRPLFTIIFKLKNGNFKTRDFSPLIEWVLAGVKLLQFSKFALIVLVWFLRNRHYNEIKSGHILLPCELILNEDTPGRFYNSTDAAWQNFKSIHTFISKAII